MSVALERYVNSEVSSHQLVNSHHSTYFCQDTKGIRQANCCFRIQLKFKEILYYENANLM